MSIFNLHHVYKRRRVVFFLGILGIIIWHFSRDSQKETPLRRVGLTANSSQFTLDGEPFRILGGSMHYFRVPRAYWSDRLLKMKACGINTLTTYVAWNLHEPERGVFNFNWQLELEAYIREAGRVGLWVILRPGPYICSEWELGGLPSWLLRDRNMKLRTTYPGFTKAVNSFFDELIPRVVSLQYVNGGPVIAFQVENEYGSYAKDGRYMSFVKEALVSRGVRELLFTSDNRNGLDHGSVNGALKTLNFQKLRPEDIRHLDSLQPQKPKLVMEYWSGWFDNWGGLHHVYDVDEMMRVVMEILNQGLSINLYMFHGGTNFGFMSGALGNHPYKPLVTSYDYDAPLSEAGHYTAKYHRLRTLFGGFHNGNLPMMPAIQWKKVYRPVSTHKYLLLWDVLEVLEKPHESERPVNMENLPVNNGNGQSYGYTLYETNITGGGMLNSRNHVRDRALVFLDRQFIGVLDYNTIEIIVPNRKTFADKCASPHNVNMKLLTNSNLPMGNFGTKAFTLQFQEHKSVKVIDNVIEFRVPESPVAFTRVMGRRNLSLLVENCGRVNYGKDLDDQRKGLVGDILLNKEPLTGFRMYSLDMKPDFIRRLSSRSWKPIQKAPAFPAFFLSKLYISGYPADSFIQFPGWKKGVAFVNGQNLGRYWSIGPQQTLYLPGPWLKTGMNQFILFEEQESDFKMQFTNNHDLGMTVDVN